MSDHNVSSNGHAHEKSDASTQPIFRFITGLAIFVAVSMVAMAMLYSYFTERETVMDTSLSPVAKETPMPEPEPALQSNPRIGLERMRTEEEVALTSYGWVDQPAGLVRIPIERAIELMAERGMPSRAAAPDAQ